MGALPLLQPHTIKPSSQQGPSYTPETQSQQDPAIPTRSTFSTPLGSRECFKSIPTRQRLLGAWLDEAMGTRSAAVCGVTAQPRVGSRLCGALAVGSSLTAHLAPDCPEGDGTAGQHSQATPEPEPSAGSAHAGKRPHPLKGSRGTNHGELGWRNLPHTQINTDRRTDRGERTDRHTDTRSHTCLALSLPGPAASPRPRQARPDPGGNVRAAAALCAL